MGVGAMRVRSGMAVAVAVALLGAAGGRAGEDEDDAGGDSFIGRVGEAVGDVVELLRDPRKRDAFWLARLPVPDRDPSRPTWNEAETKRAIEILGSEGELRRVTRTRPVPGSLDLPFDPREGTPPSRNREHLEMPQGMTYQNWTMGMQAMADIWVDFTIHTEPKGPAGIYLQLWDSAIGSWGQYLGLQFREDGGRIRTNTIWSRFGNQDTSDLDLDPENGYSEAAGYEGDFISLRNRYDWEVGTYTVHVHLDALDLKGVWYRMRIYDHRRDTWTVLGRMRFPYEKDGGIPWIQDRGGSWQEVFSGVDRPGQIPAMHVSVGGVYTCGRRVAARSVRTSYAPAIEGLEEGPLDNVDVSVDPETHRVHVRFGGRTPMRSEARTWSLGEPAGGGILGKLGKGGRPAPTAPASGPR